MMSLQEDGHVGPLGDPCWGGEGAGGEQSLHAGGWQNRNPGLGVRTTELRLAHCGLPGGPP